MRLLSLYVRLLSLYVRLMSLSVRLAVSVCEVGCQSLSSKSADWPVARPSDGIPGLLSRSYGQFFLVKNTFEHTNDNKDEGIMESYLHS